ncbi:MAG: YbaK/EbsC family protein [Actinobacteria bacterium]|nr:YbaK/EbsC family protein [Actinomycetota bacterium]
MTVETPALAALDALGVEHRVVRTERARSVEESASFQGIEVGALLKSLVVRRRADDYVLVLVPGDRRIDWPALRAHLGVSRLSLPDADEAFEATGYERGAITPFGARGEWPVLVDAAALEHETVAVGGGAHGVNVHLAPADLVAATGADVVAVTEPS